MASIPTTSSSTLLTYSLNTMPDPLQASPPQGNTVYGALSFVVSNSGTVAVSVTQIQFTIPIGTLAQSLTNNPDAVLYAASPSGQWNIAMTSAGVFTAVPQSGQPIVVTTDGLIFQLYNIPVNQQVGTVEIVVHETASSEGQPAQVRNAQFSVAKFPYGFFFANLTAQVPLVEIGQTVTLSWQGSDLATYTMYWDTQSKDVSQVRTWTSPPLTNDTTFLLRATIVLQGETVTRDLTTTVIVANPDLKGSTLAVSGMSSLRDAALSGTLSVNGTTTLGEARVGGLAVDGNGSFGSLNARGTTGMDNAVINGSLTAKSGSISMLGTMSILGQGTYIPNRAVQAHTDGFAVCLVYRPEDVKKESFAFARVYASGRWFEILGGSVGSFGTLWTPTMSGNANSMCIPIAAGSTWQFEGYNNDGNQEDSPIYFFWFPLGNNAQAKATYRILEAHEATLVPPPAAPVVAMKEVAAQRQARATDFISKLGKAFGKELDKETQDSLAELLKGTF